jgi:hypothetical protein
VHLAEDEGSLDECGELIGEGFRIGCAGHSGEVAEAVAMLSFLLGRDGVHGIVRIRELGGGVDELAAVEVGGVEPGVEDVEDGQEQGARVFVREAFCRGHEGLRLPFLALPDGGDEQVVAAFEVLVEGCLRDAGRSDDLVDADGLEAEVVDQLDGDIDEPKAALFRVSEMPKSSATVLRFLSRATPSPCRGLTCSTPGVDRQ